MLQFGHGDRSKMVLEVLRRASRDRRRDRVRHSVAQLFWGDLVKQKPLIVLHALKHHSLADTIASALSQFGLTLTDGAEIDISVRNNGAVRMIQVDLPPDVTAPPTHRIRRCDGNRDAWLIIALRPDGTEVDSFGGWTTSYSVDTLLKSSGHLTPKPGDRVELVP